MSGGLLNNPAVASNGPSLEEWDKQVFSGWTHKTPSDIMADVTAMLEKSSSRTWHDDHLELQSHPLAQWAEDYYSAMTGYERRINAEDTAPIRRATLAQPPKLDGIFRPLPRRYWTRFEGV